jgi:diaminopimelate epimerase
VTRTVFVEKGHGLGNDYLVVNTADLPWPLTPARAQALCDRHRGIGSDGVLLVDTSQRPFLLRILNPDGSEAEKSGNGLRIVGAWLYGHGLVRAGEWFDVALSKDTVQVRIETQNEDRSVDVRVEMGVASFRGDAVQFKPRAGETIDYRLALPEGGSARIHTVSLANPHCVVFVNALEREDFLKRAPSLCTHEAFEAGTNVQFAHIIGPNRIQAWIWERGAGETLASGSSACAVACAAVKRGLASPGRVDVVMMGGTVQVNVDADYRVMLRGPAQLVFRAEMSEGLIRELEALP